MMSLFTGSCVVVLQYIQFWKVDCWSLKWFNKQKVHYFYITRKRYNKDKYSLVPFIRVF